MSEPINYSVHTDAFGTEVSYGDTVAFCFTKWQGHTRMVKGTVIGTAAKSFHIEVEGKAGKVTILKVKVVKL